MRKKSGANFDELLNKEWSNLTKAEHADVQALFKKTEQRNGGISFYDMINIIRSIGLTVTEERKDKINKEIAQKEIRVLDLSVLLSQAATLKKEREDNSRGDVSEDNQYLDAFVALGGSRDKSGTVRKSDLIETIKKQFELTFDIEALVDGLQGQTLDYNLFCSIFEQDKERGEGRLASSASQRSLRSTDSMRSLVLEEKDYSKFLSFYENEDTAYGN